jgi:spore coat polysaccharide biosynthesis protein SpsF
MKVSIGIIILARSNSSRLPQKHFIKIGKASVLSLIVESLCQVVSKSNIVLATSINDTDDDLVKSANDLGIDVYRGALENVALRFFEAAVYKKWDYAIRINGDNIFIDINLLEHVIYYSEKKIYNFITNKKEQTYPKGMSIESVKVSYFKSNLAQIMSNPEDQEHVTTFFYKMADITSHYYIYNTECPSAGGINLALDTTEDLMLIKSIFTKLTRPHYFYTLSEIYDIYLGIIETKSSRSLF